MLRLVFYFLALPWFTLANGPVNTDNSVPWAGANEDGDTLAIGNLKTVLTWQDDAKKRLYATFKFNQETISKNDARYTGGLKSQNIHDNTGGVAAIACSSYETWLFTPVRSRESPTGSWKLASQSIEPRVCAMTTNGHYAIYYPGLQKLEIDGQTSFLFNINIGGQKSDLVAIGRSFLILSNSGMSQSVYQQNGNGDWKQSGIQSHPYRSGFWSDTTRFAGSDQYLIKTDAEQTDLLSLNLNNSNATNNNNLAGQVLRLPVNPCDSNEVCMPWISSKDQSWIISGFWGHYLGVGKTFVRLALPLSSTGKSGVAIAHQGLSGQFVYLGNDDGDTGLLRHGKLSTKAFSRDWSTVSSWFVWEKVSGLDVDATIRRKDVYIPLSSPSQTTRGLVLKLMQGPLPSRIPSNWAAFEPADGIAVDTRREESKSLPSKEFGLPFFKPSLEAGQKETAWWPSFLGVQESWNLAQQANITPSIVKIGVVDSGALISHPALQGGLFVNPNEKPSNKLDDDDNDYIDDISGYDFVQENGNVVDLFGHGTHVSGLLIGKDDTNGITAPAAKNGKLIVARALDRYGKSNSIDLARALYYAMQQDAEVINCSWGGGSVTQALSDVFAALKNRGIVVFSSAGNDGLNTDPPNNPEVPKVFEGVISIAAISSSRGIPRYSNYGQKTVDFFAPGDKILSTTMDGKFGILSGTSMASPVALSSFTWIYGLLKSRCEAIQSNCNLNKQTLIATSLKILCDTADVRGVEGKSKCGAISLESATKLALSYSLSAK